MDGNYAMHMAVAGGHLDIVSYLLNFSVQYNKQYNDEGLSPRTLAEVASDPNKRF